MSRPSDRHRRPGRMAVPGANNLGGTRLPGKGQVEQLAEQAKEQGAGLPHRRRGAHAYSSRRTWETRSAPKVIDRTGLTLENFGERAATAEGRLQVELAHLDYQAGRLVRSWTHLERERGGFGFLGGPGETQIEADRLRHSSPWTFCEARFRAQRRGFSTAK